MQYFSDLFQVIPGHGNPQQKVDNVWRLFIQILLR